MHASSIAQKSPTLVLNNRFEPIDIVRWDDAFGYIQAGKAWIVESYIGLKLRSATRVFEWPAVVALYQYARPFTRMPLTRANLLARDLYTCQYCGEKPVDNHGQPRLEMLDMEHVIPRAQSKNGRVWLPWSKKSVPTTCWENLAASCKPCNNLIKRDMTPEQAGMKLARYPRRPGPIDALWVPLIKVRIPTEWQDHVPSKWRGYWDTELDPG